MTLCKIKSSRFLFVVRNPSTMYRRIVIHQIHPYVRYSLSLFSPFIFRKKKLLFRWTCFSFDYLSSFTHTDQAIAPGSSINLAINKGAKFKMRIAHLSHKWEREKVTSITWSAPKVKVRISRTLPDLLQSPHPQFLSLSLRFARVRVLTVKVLLRRPRDEGGSRERVKRRRREEVYEAEKKWERVGRSPDFLWGRMYVGGRETRMRRGTRNTPGVAHASIPSSGRGCSTFFSVTGRRCAGHRRRREHGRDRAVFSCWLPPPHVHTSALDVCFANNSPC